MKNTKKKLNKKTRVIESSFSGSNLTRYSGLNVVGKYLNQQGIIESISSAFPTVWHNATKFGISQILMSIILASVSGINRMNKIARFTQDGLVQKLLNLEKGINKDALSKGLKNLGQVGARKLQSLLLARNSRWLAQSGFDTITLDADSTVKSVSGNQEGTAKGFNTTKKGAKSYHPLLVFVSEIKLLYHTWFRTGSAHTGNGICDLLQEVKQSLPKTIKKVFFRADSGFFSGKLFDQLESFQWDYLVKVKLKNLKMLLLAQEWEVVDPKKDIAICEFEYKCGSWKRSRMFKAIRTVKEYIEVDFLEGKKLVPVYQYACYVSTYEHGAQELHDIYKQRSTSETWIEQVKGQVKAGSTLTDDFWANDILWQLSVFAYNISVMMRRVNIKFQRQEHQTFIDWFIMVPARIIQSSRKTLIKMYRHHFYREDWEELDRLISSG